MQDPRRIDDRRGGSGGTVMHEVVKREKKIKCKSEKCEGFTQSEIDKAKENESDKECKGHKLVRNH